MKKMLFVLLALLSFTVSAIAAVNLNTASQAELEALSGIGPAKAKAIIDYRQKNGGFKSVDELEKVQGIGPGIVKKLRPDVSLSGKPAAQPVKAAAQAAKPPVKSAAKPVVADTKAKAK